MSATLDPPRLGAEHRGQARLFRDAVKAGDHELARVVGSIARPLRARLARHPRLRCEQIMQAERLYRALTPARFRLGPIEVERDRDAFRIAELRLTSTWLFDRAWGDDPEQAEQGIAVAAFSLAQEGRRLVERWAARSLVSLHALGRWQERNVDRSHAALLADLGALAEVGDATDDRVVTPSGGRWLGNVRPVRGDRHGSALARSVRTYVSIDWRGQDE
jgi:hypothetical protein